MRIQEAVSQNQHTTMLSAILPRTACVGTALGSCCYYYAFRNEAPFTKRPRCILTTPAMEEALGSIIYEKLVREAKSSIVPEDHPLHIELRRLGERIDAAATDLAEANNLPAPAPHTITLIHSDTDTAMAIPGNRIVVATGLISQMKNEDEVAFVLGHEVAHSLCRHSGERITGALTTGLLTHLSLLIDPSGILLNGWSPATHLLQSLPTQRVQEFEADRIGQLLVSHACFDPHAASRFFAEQAPEHGFLSTHPSHEQRAKKLAEWAPEAAQQSVERCAVFHAMQRAMQAEAEASLVGLAYEDYLLVSD